MNLGNSLQNSVGLLVYDGKVIESGKTHTYTIEGKTGSALNIVMAYTDAPGNPGSGRALVNDLDLLVKTPNGKLIYPNSRTNEQGADDLNNVEGVRISAKDAVTGTYVVTVRGTDINTGMDPSIRINGKSITDGKSNAIRYSLVVNGGKEKSVDIPPDAPANDNIANAVALSAQSGSTSGSNVSATKDEGNLGGYASVWWKWTPSKSGTAAFDTEGSSFDTTLTVYTRHSSGTYKLERENNDATIGVSHSRVEFEAAAGTTYYVAVGGVSGKTGSIKLKWDLQVVQKSDLCFGLGSSNSSWPAAVFLSGTMGSAAKTTTFKNKQTIYAYWSVKNAGNVSPSANSVILHEILKSGAVVQSWTEKLSAVAAGAASSRGNNLDSHFSNLGEGSYTYRITLDSQKAIDELDENNNVATYSFTIQAPTPLATPTNLQAMERNLASYGCMVQLTWDAVTDDNGSYIEGYRVYRNTTATRPSSPWRTVAHNKVSDSTCKANTTYYYWVVAFDGSTVSSPTSYVSVRPTSDGSGTTFSASAAVNGTSIVLQWNGVSTWASSIYIYRSIDGVMPSATFTTVSKSATTWTDSGVEPGTGYYYWVMVKDSVFGDVFSERLSATVPVQKADLGFYQWTGWPKAVFLSDSPSEAVATSTFKSGQNIYLWNGGSNFGYATVPAGWKTRHQVLERTSGHVIAEMEESRSALTIVHQEGSAWVLEHASFDFLQNLPAGTYVYRAILDDGDIVDEGNEANNVATFDFEVVNESCDIGYCGWSGWLEQMFLSPHGSHEGHSPAPYIPVHRFFQGGSPDVNLGIANWSKTTCLLKKMEWRIFDASGNLVKDCNFDWNWRFDAENWYKDSVGWQWPCGFESLDAGTYRLQIVLDYGEYANDTDRSNNTNSFVFAVTNAANKTIANALEADNLTFTANGANPPFVQTQVAYDGADAVQFGPSAPIETNSLSTVVVGPGKLSFRWFCACESSQLQEGHRLAFLIDGTQQRRIYGDGRPDNWKWIAYECDIPSGQHTLTWAYCRDAYADKYLDSAWLDQVSWIPFVIPSAPTAKTILGDDSGVKITFGSSANATAYRIYRAEVKSLPGASYDEIPSSAGGTVEYQDISAVPGVGYHYWVSAVGTGGESGTVYCGTAYRRAAIGVSPDSVAFDGNGGEQTVSVWANSDWDVYSKPDWLKASRKTIELDERSEVVLAISADGVTSGREGIVRLVASKNTVHPAYAEINVSQSGVAGPTPPSWTPVAKEDTMIVYATVFDTSANAALEADGTRLGAFTANGECRGWAAIMDGPAGRLFQLSVGVESVSESGIVLKVWNPETGDVVEILERIACNADKQIGTIAAPYTFKIGALELAVDLKEGWNWISTCLTADDSNAGTVFAGCTFANNDVVKTSNGAATYYNGTWYPAPASFRIEPGVAYVVKKSAGGTETVTLRGTLMDDGIPVKVGWNWIGMPHMSGQTISDVTHSGGFVNDDVVKSSTASATYYQGQWYPATFSLSPGTGYKANLSKAGTLTLGSRAIDYSHAASRVINSADVADGDRQERPEWTPVTQEDTLIAYVQIQKPDGTGYFESEGSVLAAFSHLGECRGVVDVMDGPAGKIYQLSIGVTNVTESGFTLQLWDSASGQIYAVNERLACNAEKTIGKIFNPVCLTVEGDESTKSTLTFNANGGSVGEASRRVAEGAEVGELPLAKRDGYAFLGWYTAKDGGAKVTSATKMVGYDVTLYAHWEPLAAGSCPEKAIPFPFGPSVATYPVSLAKEWLADEGQYDESSGVLYCKSTVARGKVYTIALPVGQEFEVACADAGAVVEYASDRSLRYCRIDARNLSAATAELMLAACGAVGARTTVYVVEGDLVPAGAVWEDPDEGGLPGSCLGKATAFGFGPSVAAQSVRFVREWDEDDERYLDGGVHYLAATAPASGRLTVATPAILADGCEVSCAGNAVAEPELFGGLALWIFDAEAGDEVLVRLEGARGADATVYTSGGDYLAKKLVFGPNGGSCPVSSKEVRAGSPVGELPVPVRAGHAFLGWYTAREGGAKVTPETKMVNSDVTLYAHWEEVAYGSCLKKAIPFPFGPSVAAYPVTLVKEWDADLGQYYEESGVLYCKSTVSRGKVYTIALPVGWEFDVSGDDATMEYATHGSLRYCRIDTRNLSSLASESTATDLLDVRTAKTGDVVPGVWHANLDKAREYAELRGLPLVAVWSNGDGCGHCIEFENCVMSPAFRNWMRDSGIVFYFGERNDAPDGQEGYHGTSFYWCCKNQNATMSWPYVRVYWPKGGVDVAHSGAWYDGEDLGAVMRCFYADGRTDIANFIAPGDYGTYNPGGRRIISVLAGTKTATAVMPVGGGVAEGGLLEGYDASVELVLAVYGPVGERTTVYVSEGDLVPANAVWEDPAAGGFPGSCLGKATGLEFAAGVQAKAVRLVREWDEDAGCYLDGGVYYLRSTASADGPLTVAVPAAQADGCEVACGGYAASREDFGSLALWIFDAEAGDEVLVRLEGARGADATVYTFGGDYLAKRLLFDANGWSCQEASREVRAGVPVGELPVPDDRAGHAFLGWFTAREGGARVTAATVMVGYDVTLYAHWEKLAAGSSQEAAIPFAMTTSVAAYPVALAKEWLDDELKYSDEWGAFYCKTTLKRGKVYTMAVPHGLDEVDAWCGNGEASVTFGSDASLQYVRFDTTNMAAAETEAYFSVFGDAGQRTTVYAVEADMMPDCSSCIDAP